MNPLARHGLQVRIISVVADAEYEGKAYGYYVYVENAQGVQWGLLDTYMEANPDWIGKTCHIEMFALFGDVEFQQGSEMAILRGERQIVILGQIVEATYKTISLPSRAPKPSVDLDVIVDVGDGLIRCNSFYHFETEEDTSSLNFKEGDFIRYLPSRIDLQRISCEGAK